MRGEWQRRGGSKQFWMVQTSCYHGKSWGLSEGSGSRGTCYHKGVMPSGLLVGTSCGLLGEEGFGVWRRGREEVGPDRRPERLLPGSP